MFGPLFNLLMMAWVCQASQPAVPEISKLLKPNVLKRVMEDREVMSHASLDGAHYSFYAAVLVRASVEQTRTVLMDYKLYAKLVPYVDQATYIPEKQLLKIEGGIWKFKMRSSISFEQKGDRWIHYWIVDGHFAGLTGDIYFEPEGEKGTAVYFRGDKMGYQWPPKFVIERGAEVVFGFTGNKMRRYIESLKVNQNDEEKRKNPEFKENSIPQPRSRI